MSAISELFVLLISTAAQQECEAFSSMSPGSESFVLLVWAGAQHD
jgi:hypothetical protein